MNTCTVTVEIHHGDEIRRGVVLTPPIWPHVSGLIPYLTGIVIASPEVLAKIADIDAEIVPRGVMIHKVEHDCFVAVVVLGGDK